MLGERGAANAGWPEAARRALEVALRAGVLAALVALIALEAAQVLLRYGFGAGLAWGRDVGGLLLFSLAWLGLPLLWLKRAHLSLSLWRLPAGVERLWDRAIDATALAAGAALLVFLLQAAAAFRFIDMAALGTDASIRTWPLIAGTCLWNLAALLNLVRPPEPAGG
ncbi:TRAP-type C4-dicarboxylate transport system permease small subunit [Hasllibacter halocynthiae]|uniref:TRAP transporter small permease protein n=1 Tax=Hasllibacter halocynthiae TaxID=595589 RepID=A0A2T0X9U5_9RHOB|nr:TRAP transporter small permease subunit [Hasllibacter halocynthiae]PRY95721.1 TRAP-type C4-dicarboxylate transport system permease small subunit [Hasllibacter halocynthiae]